MVHSPRPLRLVAAKTDAHLRSERSMGFYEPIARRALILFEGHAMGTGLLYVQAAQRL